MRISSIVLCLALLAPGGAIAADGWVFAKADGGYLGYSPEPLPEAEEGVQRGSRLLYFAEAKQEEGVSYNYRVQEFQFDCQGGMYQPTSVVLFDAKQNVLRKIDQAASAEWASIRGDHAMEAYQRLFCSTDVAEVTPASLR